MKLKSLLKLMNDVECIITTESGWELARFYINKNYGWDGETKYSDKKVVEITVITDTVFIKVK